MKQLKEAPPKITITGKATGRINREKKKKPISSIQVGHNPATQRVVFKAHPKQEEYIKQVLSFRYRYMLFGGAAGGGKTFVTQAIALILCKIYPGLKVFIIRESLPTMKRTTIPSFFKVCPKSFIKRYNKNEQTVHLKNGSQIIFFPENYNQDKHLTRFDGLEGNVFILEEGQELQEKTFQKSKLRAGRHIIPNLPIDQQPKPLILVTCNPSQNWTKTTFYEPSLNGTLPDDFYYLQSLMQDNLSLPESYIEGLENIDDITKEIFVKGNWDIIDVKKPFAYSFKKAKSVRSGLKFNESEPVILSFDFNVDPITCIAGQTYEGTIRILQEFRLRNSDIYALCEKISETFGDQYFLVTGDASGSNRSAITRGAMTYYQVIKSELDLQPSQFKVPTMNPAVRNTRVLLNSMLQNHPDFFIDESCIHLIRDLELVEVKDNGDIDKTTNKLLAHLIDTLRYFLWTFHRDYVRYLQ